MPELGGEGHYDTGSHYPKVGPVVTAGGLIFTGRATGECAPSTRRRKAAVGAGGPMALEGMPAVYQVDGRQYVVFCASAQVGLTPATQVRIDGEYIAFALK